MNRFLDSFLNFNANGLLKHIKNQKVRTIVLEATDAFSCRRSSFHVTLDLIYLNLCFQNQVIIFIKSFQPNYTQ